MLLHSSMSLERLPPDVLRFVNNFTDTLYVVIAEDGEYSDHTYTILGIYNCLDKAIMLMLGNYMGSRTYDPETKTWIGRILECGCRTYIREYPLNRSPNTSPNETGFSSIFYSLYNGGIIKVYSAYNWYYENVDYTGERTYILEDNRFIHRHRRIICGVLDANFTHVSEGLTHWTYPRPQY